MPNMSRLVDLVRQFDEIIIDKNGIRENGDDLSALSDSGNG
jgi:hypothetical protein